MLQHSDLSDDARSSILQLYAKDLHEALAYKPDGGATSQPAGSQHAPPAHEVGLSTDAGRSCSLHTRSRQTSISSADVLGLHSMQMVSKPERPMHVACLYWTHCSTTHHTSVQGVAEKREVQILLLKSHLVAAAPIPGCAKRSWCCGSAGGQCASVLSQKRLAAGSLHRHKVAIYWLHRTATGVRVEVLKMHVGLHLEVML